MFGCKKCDELEELVIKLRMNVKEWESKYYVIERDLFDIFTKETAEKQKREEKFKRIDEMFTHNEGLRFENRALKAELDEVRTILYKLRMEEKK